MFRCSRFDGDIAVNRAEGKNSCMAVSKFRFRFRKAGDLRFLSHHDLMRVFERMLRRAELPFRFTEGFHPKPKMAFASALALGIIGHQEVIEIEFDGELSAEDVLERLNAHAPSGLQLLSARTIEPRVKAQVCKAGYRIELDPDLLNGVPGRLAEIMSLTHCWIERTKPQPRRIDIRPFVHHLELQGSELSMEFVVTPQGSARPEDVLRLVGLEETLMNGAVLERTSLTIADEHPSALLPQAAAGLDSDPSAGVDDSDGLAPDIGQEEPAVSAADERI
jgi:radical SAM-linked protein